MDYYKKMYFCSQPLINYIIFYMNNFILKYLKFELKKTELILNVIISFYIKLSLINM